MTKPIAIATNNGDMGGGEVMLLHIARALRDLGFAPCVVGPASPRDVLDAAGRDGFETVALRASNRKTYMAALAAWRLRNPRIPLWCNGLVPSLATAGSTRRIVHLHSLPHGPQRAAAAIARVGSDALLVPSAFVASHVPASVVVPNWTAPVERAQMRALAAAPARIGYLGRLTVRKGVTDLADAVGHLQAGGAEVTLVVAGHARFADPGDEHAIERSFAQLNGHVNQLGWAPPADFFAAIDVLVVPSRAPETFGLVVAEAMAWGVPVVVSDAGALPEVAGPEHPWVFRAADARHLATVLGSIMREWNDSAPHVRTAARSRWEDRFSPEAGARRLARTLAAL